MAKLEMLCSVHRKSEAPSQSKHVRDYDFSLTIDGTLVSVENTIITHYSYGSIQFVSFFPLLCVLILHGFFSTFLLSFYHFNSVDKFFVSLSTTFNWTDFFLLGPYTHCSHFLYLASTLFGRMLNEKCMKFHFTSLCALFTAHKNCVIHNRCICGTIEKKVGIAFMCVWVQRESETEIDNMNLYL